MTLAVERSQSEPQDVGTAHNPRAFLDRVHALGVTVAEHEREGRTLSRTRSHGCGCTAPV